MGEQGGDEGPARTPYAAERVNPARRKSPMADTKSPSDADLQAGHHASTSTHSPRAAKAPRIHSKRSSQEAGPQTWIQQDPASTPDRARRQATGSRIPQPQLGPQYYRMALVSSIQPSFGTSFETDASRRDREDEETQNRPRGDSAAQAEWKWTDDGDGRTAPGQGGG